MATSVPQRSSRLRRRCCSPPPTTSSRPSPPAATTSTPYFLPELIPEVAKRLTSLQDFFALRAACRGYRAVLPLTAYNLASQAPLRFLDPHRPYGPAAVFDFSLRRRLRFRLPGAPNDIVSFGCRVAIYDYLGPCAGEFRIVHLLTGEQTRLPAPTEIFAFVLLSGDLVCTWIYKCRTIQYCRIGATNWSVASLTEPYHLRSLICVSGTGTLYALVTTDENPVYRLAVVELSDNGKLAELVLLGGEMDTRTQQFSGGPLDARTQPLPNGTYLSLFLAECCGELVLISEVEFNEVEFNDAWVYHVFQWKSGEAKWERMTSLGGCTLFFEASMFKGCLGPDHPGIRKDCMYFDYNEGFWTEYSLVDGSFRRSDTFYPGQEIHKDFMPSGWIFPSMC